MDPLACDVNLIGLVDMPVPDDLRLTAQTAEVLDVPHDTVDLDIFELVNCVHVPIGVHLVEFSQVVLYHVNLQQETVMIQLY